MTAFFGPVKGRRYLLLKMKWLDFSPDESGMKIIKVSIFLCIFPSYSRVWPRKGA
jgi:hypothetical protein